MRFSSLYYFTPKFLLARGIFKIGLQQTLFLDYSFDLKKKFNFDGEIIMILILKKNTQKLKFA